MLAHLNNWAAIPFDFFARRRDCAKQCGSTFADFCLRVVRKGVASALKAVPAGIGFDSAQFGQYAPQYFNRTWNDFAAHAITGDDTQGRGV